MVGLAGWVGEAELSVLGMSDRLVEERRDVLVVQGVVNVSALSVPDDEAKVAQQPQLLAGGGLFHSGTMRELADGARPVAQLREQTHAAGRGQGLHELGYALGGFGADAALGGRVGCVTHRGNASVRGCSCLHP